MKHRGQLPPLPSLEALESRLLLDGNPLVLATAVNDGAAQRATIQSVSISFDKDVSASLVPGDLVLHNNTTGADVIISGATVSFDHGWDIARWDLSHTPLPDGNYVATLPAGAVADSLGDTLANDYKFSFYKYYGDNDGTRATDTTDLFALRDTYLKSAGDAGYNAAFDSDGDGDVDSADLFQFRSNYTHSLAAPTTNLLMVDNGNGDGQYAANATVTITAAAAPPGKVFNMWVGDIPISTVIGSATAATTTYKMPAGAARLIATYRDIVFSLDDSTDWLPKTQVFDNATFGAEKEPLAYQIFGNTLAFQADGEYKYASETSAFLAFETNLPARTYIEYGTTTSYGQYSQQLDRYNYLHNYNLTDLTNGATYHYRFVAQDERGNILISGDKTLVTATPSNVVYISGGHFTSAYTCNQSGKTYLLTGDVVADGTAFEITANNVTLDLGGHKVVYDNTNYQVPDSSGNWYGEAYFGVKGSGRSGLKVLNGFIKQGLGNNHANIYTTGYAPLALWSTTSSEVAGITAEYSGGSVDGFDLYNSALTARFNTFIDHGGYVRNRDYQVAAIWEGGNPGGTLNHSLILRARQSGLHVVANQTNYDNEIYLDSVCTNSSGMSAAANGTNVYGNRIFGSGYLPIGIFAAAGNGVANVNVHDNFIHLQAVEPDNRWPEFGATSYATGIRAVWGGTNISVHDNVVSVYARDGGSCRGLWMYTESTMNNVVWANNTVQAIMQNIPSGTYTLGAVDATGDGTNASLSTIYATFQNNRIISNFTNVMFDEAYGCGNNTLWLGNTLVKSPLYPQASYVTLRYQENGPLATNHQFFDTAFEGGASFDSVGWEGWGTRNFYVGWTLTVQTTPGATVTIKDSTNATVFTGTANASGIVTARLFQYRSQTDSSYVYTKTYYTPDLVTISKAGLTTRTATVTMDAAKTLTLLLA